jgi:hypothetical protein
MLGRPGVAGAVTGCSAGQVPQHGSRPAREAADQGGEGGVHAGWAGQRAAHVGGPGLGGVAPVVGQMPEDMGDIGGSHVEPGVAEGQAGELADGPHHRPGDHPNADAEDPRHVVPYHWRNGGPITLASDRPPTTTATPAWSRP